MLQFISNTSIFRRLFIAFAIAAIIPGIIIVLLGSYYINSLSIRGQAVRTSFDAQNVASQEQINLEGMNALLQARYGQVFASVGGNVPDPSLNASSTLINIDLLTRKTDFDQALKTYQSNYELATSSNMSTIRSILLSDDPNNSQIVNDQQAALNDVINRQWPQYSSLQQQELDQLQHIEDLLQKHTVFTQQQIDQTYSQAYAKLFQTDEAFTNLRNSWQKVVDSAISMGKTVTAVGPSQTQPVWIATTIAFLSVILVVLAAGYVVNLTITRPLRQLASLTRRISQGDTSARAEIVGHDEIHLVATSINSMLDNIV
ncbi:MAG: HAMP domain-containing protein, partial [Chloroflexi bacterium]|nr:HAMP domain-containing protein [Chloroflexota bacterium]